MVVMVVAVMVVAVLRHVRGEHADPPLDGTKKIPQFSFVIS
jgi:hypothetical protein